MNILNAIILLLLLTGVLSTVEGDDIVREAFWTVSGESAWRTSPVVVGGKPEKELKRLPIVCINEYHHNNHR